MHSNILHLLTLLALLSGIELVVILATSSDGSVDLVFRQIRFTFISLKRFSLTI